MTAADRRKLNKDAGFSLLELLIAVVILAIIVIPLMNLFLSSNRLNIKSRETLRATTAAQDIMEGLKAYNIEEIKTQFDDPASGFYVIDSRLIKGDVEEVEALEKDPSGNPIPGLYVFSMKEVNLQGSQFDAKIEVDGREYRTDTSTASPDTHDNKFNDAALSYARSIDRNHGTFVETDKIRGAVLSGVFKDSVIENSIKEKLKADPSVTDVEAKYGEIKIDTGFKNITSYFDKISRRIEVELTKDDMDLDENGEPRVFMKVRQTYYFTCPDPTDPANLIERPIMGDIDAGYLVDGVKSGICGKLTAVQDGSPHGSLNVNLFYYPLYGPSGKVEDDQIIIKSNSEANLNLLIAKQRYDIGDPDYLADHILKQAEELYHAKVEIKTVPGTDMTAPGADMNADQFTLRTNLGMNLVEAVKGTPVYVDGQFYLGTTPMVAATPPADGSVYHIFTLDGVRSPMGKAAASDETAELIYDVKVSIYRKGAADNDFPDDDRMVEITGSMTN